MINLIESDLSAADIAAVLRKTKLRPPMPAMDSPEWEAARRNPAVVGWMKGIRELAAVEAFEPLPVLTDELYAIFYKTKERLTFERVYFQRRMRLARVAMTFLMGDDATRQRFAPALVAQIEDIMGEESWTLPAHAWTQPTGKDPYKIDLMAAETANLMGELLNLFGAIIPKDLEGRIRLRLQEQVFDNYLHPRSEFIWNRLPMNWNAVCHQGVIGAALALEVSADLLGELLAPMAVSLRIFLSGFGADGSTSEGPGYWVYGFGRFADLNAQIETATDGTLSLFGNNDHIRRIAQFAPGLVFSNGRLVNFSDGNHQGRLAPSLLAYLGERLDLPVLKQESAVTFRHSAENGIPLQEHRCDVYTLTRHFLRCPPSLEGVLEPVRPDIFFPDYGALVARGTDDRGNLLEFAAKAGHNAEHHNHNDCGSYILNLNGESAIMEIGAPEYCGDFFSSDETRYTFLAARSLGHSVPLVNGCEQRHGAEFAARVIESELGNARVGFVIDLTKCHPAEARCHKLVRSFVFEKKAGRLTVTDTFELEGPGLVESIIMSETPARVVGEAVRLDTRGGAVQVTPLEGTVFSGFEPCTYKDHGGKEREIYRLRFRAGEITEAGVIAYAVDVL